MKGSRLSAFGSRLKVIGVALIAVVVSAHVGSPDVFYSGKAGAYDVHVVIRPPQVVPGIARVSVTAPEAVTRVAIRPVYWRAGSKGAPSPDEMRRIEGTTTWEGSLWLMAHGAYVVDVTVFAGTDSGNVQVPVASVATGRLGLSPGFGAFLALLGAFLVAGLVTIVYKGAGEALVDTDRSTSAVGRAPLVAGGVASVMIAVALFGGARWWNAVDRDYERSRYVPSPLEASLSDRVLRVKSTDVPFHLPGRRARYVPDHGKLMHLLMVKADDATGFAHLHPRADGAPNPTFTTVVPPLPAGTYRLYADVVHDAGLERTMVGSIDVPPRSTASRFRAADEDDSWFEGAASTTGSAPLADGSSMTLSAGDAAVIRAGDFLFLTVQVRDRRGQPAALEPYLGMPAHAVVTSTDGSVYVHLHPMGNTTMAAREIFAARDRGDTTATGDVQLTDHSMHVAPQPVTTSTIAFPYAFPKAGSYRVFAQVKRDGRILTAAFVVDVADSVATR